MIYITNTGHSQYWEPVVVYTINEVDNNNNWIRCLHSWDMISDTMIRVMNCDWLLHPPEIGGLTVFLRIRKLKSK